MSQESLTQKEASTVIIIQLKDFIEWTPIETLVEFFTVLLQDPNLTEEAKQLFCNHQLQCVSITGIP
jgi:hypothetical protein